MTEPIDQRRRFIVTFAFAQLSLAALRVLAARDRHDDDALKVAAQERDARLAKYRRLLDDFDDRAAS